MSGRVAALKLDDDLTRKQHARALAELIEGEVRFGLHDRMLYATDASIYQVEPIGVVIPKHHEDVVAAVKYCAEHGLPILPRGGGTSLAGQCTNRAVVIDVSAHLTDLEWVDGARRVCHVQPGITIDDLNDRLRADGLDLFFAPDPATSRQCNIGGAIGNNAAGTRSILYGRTSENLEAVSVLLPSGEECTLAEGSCVTDPVARRLGESVIDICTRYERQIRERFPETLRRNAGYALDMMLEDIDGARRDGVDPLERLNLAHLICGSEGTLAFVTGATLKLHRLPKAKGLAVIGFDTLEDAIGCVLPLLELKPSAVELLDDLVVGLARENIEYSKYVELLPQPEGVPIAAVLYVEFFSDGGVDRIEERFERTREVVRRRHPRAGFAAYTDATSMLQAQKLRKAGEPLLHGVPGERKPLGFVEDNAVPVERLAGFVRGFKAILEREGTRGAFWAHASVGVLHVRPFLSVRDAQDRARMERIAVAVADLARSLGGVMSGEHGDGRARGPLLERYFGPELMRAFREVKALFDPGNLLNPGNIVEPGPIESIHERARVRPNGFDLHAPDIDTYFDYSREGGFDQAVELCNGSGVCRKKQGGTMCPSYMGTLDERHSTRGRGNALRLAITGQLWGEEAGGEEARAGKPPVAPVRGPKWNDEATLATLDLCLSCKACKSECPTNVDIAQYKAEYLAQSYKATGRIPLRARVFGNVRTLNRLGSAFAPLSNWLAGAPPLRAIANRALGLHPKRTLPAFERSLPSRLRRAPWFNRGVPDEAPAVILYADCFTMYNEPDVGLAAARLLNAFGYRVELVDAGCCGRAAISNGLLESACATLPKAAGALAAAFDRTLAVGMVVCEPSCLSAIKDEWLKVRAMHDRAEDLASRSFLVEQFLEARWEGHARRPRFRPASIALHGHCHQKALWGVRTSGAFLGRIVGKGNLVVLDTGCCGMAGSFGYTAGRHDVAMRIGELALFPALRALAPGCLVAAPGTSCRHQIKDGTCLTARHPVEIAADLLPESHLP